MAALLCLAGCQLWEFHRRLLSGADIHFRLRECLDLGRQLSLLSSGSDVSFPALAARKPTFSKQPSC